jgi:predicted hydrocarbon binding protein
MTAISRNGYYPMSSVNLIESYRTLLLTDCATSNHANPHKVERSKLWTKFQGTQRERVRTFRTVPGVRRGGSLMNGFMLKGFKDFIVDRHDHEAWQAIQSEAGVEGKIYVPVTEYPDKEVTMLVEAASSISGTDISELLEKFGRFLVPRLVDTYGVHMDDNWTGLKLISCVEKYIHTALREKKMSSYTPPELQSGWVQSDRVRIVYNSDRKLCHFARGLIIGIGEHFDESYEIEETSCMHNGDDRCDFVVRRGA